MRRCTRTPTPTSLILVASGILLFAAVQGEASALPAILEAPVDAALPCQSDADCKEYSNKLKDAFCKHGFCQCKEGQGSAQNCSSATIDHPIIRNAEASSINFRCTDDKQCTANFPNTVCRGNKCACKDGYHNANGSCFRKVEFGKNCTKKQECSHIDGAVCLRDVVCGCPAETVINMDRKRCLRVAREISEECTEDAQCSTTFENSLCLDKTCQCKSEYHYVAEESACFASRGLDETCANRHECYQPQDETVNVTGKALDCSSNVCVCADSYYREEGMCLNAASQLLLPLPIILSSMLFIVLQLSSVQIATYG